jgi:Phytanoyl-CoA dioxygenase (PhyH)
VEQVAMNLRIDIGQIHYSGWTRIDAAVPQGLCDRLVDSLESEAGVPVNNPSRWGVYGGEMRDLVPIWGHQTQWDIRQHPNMHRVWAQLCGTERLGVSLDSCRFTPPWKLGHAEPGALHWDQNPWNAAKRMFQGVLALTDTAIDQGGFCCVPSLYRNPDAWPVEPIIDEAGAEEWLANTNGCEIVHVPARAGDLVVWDSRLPHSDSKNLSGKPRIAFYVMMGPTDEGLRRTSVESWRSGRCVPWWRDRYGYDRIETWPPANLTELGRRLLGLDPWP